MPLNPYSRLKAEFQKFAAQIDAVKGSSVRAFWWTKQSVAGVGGEIYRDIAEQVKAARTLGRETLVVENDGALEFYFRTKIPQTPFI